MLEYKWHNYMRHALCCYKACYITAYETNNIIEYTWNISIYEMKFPNEKER